MRLFDLFPARVKFQYQLDIDKDHTAALQMNKDYDQQKINARLAAGFKARYIYCHGTEPDRIPASSALRTLEGIDRKRPYRAHLST